MRTSTENVTCTKLVVSTSWRLIETGIIKAFQFSEACIGLMDKFMACQFII